ncbi:MAG: hypothetical protein JWM43_157 [Acidobacteriaceae bacterium]|nr:hypothetical protein [Acidobacteriaceae bacterium]
MHLFGIAVLIASIGLPWWLHRYASKRPEAKLPPYIWRVLPAVLIVAFLCWCSGTSKIDDSFIYARYVGNALSGHGMVFNVGEHVNALTSPLFAYLLLLVSWILKGNVLLATVLLSAFFMMAACALAELVVPFSGLLLAGTAYFYELVGMETSLFIFFLLACIALLKFERYQWLPLCGLLAVLSRFEGGLLVALIALEMYRRKAFPNWTAFIPPIAVAGAYLCLNHSYYGTYLPSSTIAKLGQGFSGYWGRWPTAFLGHLELLREPFEATIYLVPLALGLAVATVVLSTNRLLNRVALPFCVLLLLFYVGFNMTGLYFWYFAPFILFVVLYAAHSIPRTRAGYAVAGVSIALLAALNGNFLRHPRREARYAGYVDAGRWLQQNTPATARVAAVEIGFLGWYSQRYLIDIVGLTTPKNAVHVAQRDLASWLHEDRPDYILLHDASWPWEQYAKQSADYLREPVELRGGIYLVRRKDYKVQAADVSTPPAR